ncbi:hypothetical protein RAH32_08900 [Paracoccus sp. WLY502]|uniref:hypothetical protein n=1 Tax=Paracoccus yibinensis TaxID=3068891 RepID=UPI002796DAD1|nr:hypothetical protein [Paracoccus sp. WLY502]MDQ1900561.1 hypothetical protein [Paracoccus sp. WLY502]
MNIPVDRKLCRPGPHPLAAPPDEATVIAMGAMLSAVFFDRQAGPRTRMQAEQDGLPIPRPLIGAELALRTGGTRHVLFVPQGIETLQARHLVLRLDGVAVAEIDPNWLQPPEGELPALIAQLSVPGLRKLLRVMMAGASLFAAPAQAGLAEAIARLMDVCAIPACAPVAETRIAGRLLVSYAVPGLPGMGHPADAAAFLNGRLVRLKDFDCLAEGKLLHVLLPAGLGRSQILALTDRPLRLAAGDALLRRLPVSAWLRARSQACKDWLFGLTGTIADAPPEPSCEREEPKIAIRHLSSTAGGILYALTLTDPSRMAGKVILERQGRTAELETSRKSDGTAILTGLADLPPQPGGEHTCRIRIVDHSGQSRLWAETTVPAYDGGIPDGFRDAWIVGAGSLRSLAQARAGFRRLPPPCTVQHFGPLQKPRLRILTLVGDSADVIRARAAMIMAEGQGIPVEVVCTMTEGPLAIGARQALAQTAAIYGVPHRLLLLPDFATSAERMHAALSDAKDAPVLVLGGDVLPATPGWISFWLRRLRRRAALAPALLARDGSVAATREGLDPCRGLPAQHLPQAGQGIDRPLPSCLALAPEGIARLLASVPHPDPAIWMAQALQGCARSETRHPFRRFGPAPAPDDFATALSDAEFSLIEKVRE